MTNTNTARIDELEDALEQALDGDTGKAPGYIVTSLEDATWAAMKRDQHQRKVDDIRGIAARKRAVIDEWEADAVKADLERVEYFDGLLTFYHQTVLNAEVKAGTKDKHLTKSVKLPKVTLTSRAGAAEWSIDDDAFQPWAAKHRPDLIETTTKTKLAEVKKALTPSAGGTASLVEEGAEPIVVPGVTVADKPRTFAVKPA